jgi:BirA family biotin operon repressor/biotin-[acetyl-CoA-carboxylase] ligase
VHLLLIPLLRILSDGKFHAGSELAQNLGVSRATVSNALKTADTLSVSVFKVRGRGYQLPHPPEWLDAEAVRQQLGLLARDVRLEVVDTIGSTNSTLLRESTTHCHCLAAEYQYAGRGRRGRQWFAALGGSLSFSMRWRFNQGMGALAGLSLAVGVAVLRTLHQFDLTEVRLKWPNDLLWREKKLAGILIEAQGDANDSSIAVIGIGINLHIPNETRERIDQPITDLQEIAGHTLPRNMLLGTLIQQLVLALQEFEAHGLVHLSQEWNAAHAYSGQPLCVTLANGDALNGSAEGINHQGELLLKLANGKVIAIHSGEVQLARPSYQDFSGDLHAAGA